jgi:hypothetical protein
VQVLPRVAADVGQQATQLGHGEVEVLVELLVVQQPAGAAPARPQVGDQMVQPLDQAVDAQVERAVGQQPPGRTLPAREPAGDGLQVAGRLSSWCETRLAVGRSASRSR